MVGGGREICYSAKLFTQRGQYEEKEKWVGWEGGGGGCFALFFTVKSYYLAMDFKGKDWGERGGVVVVLI